MNNDNNDKIYYFDENGNKKSSVWNFILNEDLFFENDDELMYYLTELLTPEQRAQSAIIRGIRTKIRNQRTVPIIKDVIDDNDMVLDNVKNIEDPEDKFYLNRNIRMSIIDKLKLKKLSCNTLKCISSIDNAINKQNNKIYDVKQEEL